MGIQLTPRAPRGEVREDPERLLRVLDAFRARFDVASAVRRDPVELVHAAPAEEREVVALLCALLAFGNVVAMKAALRRLLHALGPSPTRTLRSARPAELARHIEGFRYRWIGASDLAPVLVGIGRVLAEEGTLERAFVSGGRARGLAASIDALRSRIVGANAEPLTRGARFLLPSPGAGSTCKRWCLFLRWVVRKADGVDLGLWSRVRASDLVMPVDTHIARIARYIGLTQRATPSWKMALEVTDALREIAPADPLRYDFTLCHLGISRSCKKRREPAICAACDLHTICRLESKGRR
jgi:uncharacterized protein (TIGR02757 family)